ncbi:MAG: TolC family protein [Magnetococcales bacterium]|nr:TolC family protein [Magnetococcales bacterium]
MKRAVLTWMLLAWAVPVWADPASGEQPVGATVDEFLALAREINPEIAARALEAEAAAAWVEGADAFPDPKLQITLDDISRNAAGLPGRVATTKYTLQQEIPWWGKRALQREIAVAASREAESVREERKLEVAMKVKMAYADYHRVHLSMDQTDELIQIMRVLVEFARFRYAQGMGSQQEATSAEAERGALSMERVRLLQERHRIRARLNALVGRPAEAPVVEHPHLRELPETSLLDYRQLLERGLAANPSLGMARARVASAEGETRLAKKAWYPDWEVGFGVVERRNVEEMDSYEAMVGVSLPLQWSAKKAKERETALKEQAARQDLVAERLRVELGLKEALSSLEEAQAVEKVTRESLLPQARIALQSALKGYENGNTEAVAVLDAVQRLKKFQIERLKAQYDQQVRLAEIERFVGGEW